MTISEIKDTKLYHVGEYRGNKQKIHPSLTGKQVKEMLKDCQCDNGIWHKGHIVYGVYEKEEA